MRLVLKLFRSLVGRLFRYLGLLGCRTLPQLSRRLFRLLVSLFVGFLLALGLSANLLYGITYALTERGKHHVQAQSI
jgi:hypothetical protein